MRFSAQFVIALAVATALLAYGKQQPGLAFLLGAVAVQAMPPWPVREWSNGRKAIVAGCIVVGALLIVL